jgi:hypothetical protein
MNIDASNSPALTNMRMLHTKYNQWTKRQMRGEPWYIMLCWEGGKINANTNIAELLRVQHVPCIMYLLWAHQCLNWDLCSSTIPMFYSVLRPAFSCALFLIPFLLLLFVWLIISQKANADALLRFSRITRSSPSTVTQLYSLKYQHVAGVGLYIYKACTKFFYK